MKAFIYYNREIIKTMSLLAIVIIGVLFFTISCAENPAHELNRKRLEKEFPESNVIFLAETPEGVKIYRIKTGGYDLFVSVACSSCMTTYTSAITR